MSAIDGDLLSATSLITAVVGLLYSTWYGDISQASNLESQPGGTSDAQVDTVRSTLKLKAAPLAVVSVAMCAVLAWPASRVVAHVFGHATDDYDPVQACFVIVFVLLGFLAVTTVRAAWSVRNTLRAVTS